MIRVRIKDLIDRASSGIWIMRKDPKDSRSWQVAKPIPLEFEKKEDYWLMPEPTLVLPYEDCQAFMQELTNALSEAGYKPNTDRLSGELDATKVHLKREELNSDNLGAILNKALNLLAREKGLNIE